jgi:hypothetical protein
VSGFGIKRAALTQAMIEAFPSMENLHEFAFLELNQNLAVLTTGPLTAAVIAIVQWAESSGKERDLLGALKRKRSGHPNLMVQVAACEELIERGGSLSYAAPDDPFEACILKGYLALFNRNELRAALRQLDTEEGRNVLVVRGEEGLGCSHSLELVVHLQGQLRTFKTATVDLETLPTDVEPRAIVIDMAQQLSIDAVPPPRDGQAARWNHDLVSWLVGHIERSEQSTWIVIDGFKRVEPRQDIVELVAELADRAVRKCLKLRVILLGWIGPLPRSLDSRILHERIGSMGREVLVDFFTQFLEHNHHPPSPDAVRRAVERLEQEVSADLVNDLPQISAGAVAIARTLAELEREP